jgi:Mn2+/Fe2+ NRAMP family transporter
LGNSFRKVFLQNQNRLMSKPNSPAKKQAESRKPATDRVRRFFADLGPGLITGAADDDPSGISTYSVAGASFGYMPLWTALFSWLAYS